ncbi:lytic transglycosylase domain-containing protein [Lederbergia citrea]|uniref:lytic transglycosylase domain-containing protein n=1 Tax=Lederbergia citrea TaxID=2833581 RepID=UPI001BCA3091|nr:lytic transglycosylase domain-containing protein [Lederbergia citrea]MBS4177395.1 lytic transglycosylase domain-containing protein [Lederbergia citrea]
MNTLGQLKTLHDIQLLRGFSSDKVSTSLNSSGNSEFEDLLQQLIHSAPPSSSQVMNINTLGAVYRMQNLGSNTVISNAIGIPNNAKGASESVKAQTEILPKSIEGVIQKASEVYKLPEKLIKAIIKHESNFNPGLVSHAGASGLMQLMPATARGLGVTDIFDPGQNVMAGSKYLRNMLDKYEGNLVLALAAYNAGPGNVDKYGGIPPFKETQSYVKKVTGTYYS